MQRHFMNSYYYMKRGSASLSITNLKTKTTVNTILHPLDLLGCGTTRIHTICYGECIVTPNLECGLVLSWKAEQVHTT